MKSDDRNRIQRFAPPRHATEADYAAIVPEPPLTPIDNSTEAHLKESIAAKKTYELQQKINATRGNSPRYAEVSDTGSIGHTARLQMEIEKKRRTG